MDGSKRMDRAISERVCRSVEEATAQVREVFRTRMETSEVLDRFWCVQDQLNRLLNTASENPREFFSIQQRAYPSLIWDVIDLISFAAKGNFTRTAAVNQSCESINRLLIEITRLKAESKRNAYTAVIWPG